MTTLQRTQCSKGGEHVASVNPRHDGRCVKCGGEIPANPKRDPAFEEETIRELTAGLSVEPTPLVNFARRRADSGGEEYGFDFPSLSRDLVLEGLREGGDWTNYLVWELDKIRRGLAEGGERVEHLQRALRYVALAFAEANHARG